jgi:hypothetical protein
MLNYKLLRFSLFAVGASVLIGGPALVGAEPVTDSDRLFEPISLEFDASTDGEGFIPEDLKLADSLPSRAIIGTDDRIPVLTEEYPFSAIGRIYWLLEDGREIGYCTGALVGRDLILTNSHCLTHPLSEQVVDPQTYQSGQDLLAFVPNMVEGNFVSQDVALVTDIASYGWQSFPANVMQTDPSGVDVEQAISLMKEDWALLKLDKPLGDIYGWLGWLNLDYTNQEVLDILQSNVFLAGYSGDYPGSVTRTGLNLGGVEGETAGIHLNCSINEAVDGDLLLHDCDTMGGASGSPVFTCTEEECYILGLHRGSVPLNPEEVPFAWRETCVLTYDDQGYLVTVDACRNIAVNPFHWATQALELINSGL